MDATTTRQQNFLQLFKEFREETQSRDPNQPNRGLLKLFAAKVEISDRLLSHIKCGRKTIGAADARQIESQMGKPHGWLDQIHDENLPDTGQERVIVEQILALYRSRPGAVQRLIADAIKTVIEGKTNDQPPGPGSPGRTK